MPSTLTRDDLLLSLTISELKKGKGTTRQQLAWQELEWRKCANDPVYFIENYGWLKSKSGPIIPWVMWPAQKQVMRDFAAGKSLIAVKARQLGITTVLSHGFLWKTLFQDASQCHLVSDSEDKAKEALSRVRITMDRLPEWMKQRGRRGGKLAVDEVVDRKDRSNGRTRISFGYSEFTIRTSTPNSVAGLTGCIFLDEFSRHRDQEAVYDNVIPAVDGGGQLLIIANGQGEDEFYNLYQASKRGENGLTHYFFSWRDDPSRDDQWYEDTKRRYLRKNTDRDAWNFRAQYPSNEEEAFYLNPDSRFDMSALQGFTLLAKQMPVFTQGYLEREGDALAFKESGRIGRMRLYEAPVEGASYVMGVDPAGGGAASDYSVIQVCRLVQHSPDELKALYDRFGYGSPPIIDDKPAFEVRDNYAALEQVMSYQAKTEPAMLGTICKRIGEWYNDALAVVELNQHGGTVVDRMKDDYWNLYREVKTEKIADEESDRIGYWSDKHSKMEMVDNLAEWLHSGWLLMRDSATITELSRYGWQVSPSGSTKLGCPKGMNDDLVIGLALCVVGARSLLVRRRSTPTRSFMPWEI